MFNGQNTIPLDDALLVDTLTTINRAGADVIYLPVEAPIVNRIAHQLTELNLQTKQTLLGSDSWEATELDSTVTTGSYFTTHFVLDDNRPIVQSWRDIYKSTYAVEPDTLATLGYDATATLAAAIEQADALEPNAVAKILKQETFDGVTGQINFDNQHNPRKPVPIVSVGAEGPVFSTSGSP